MLRVRAAVLLALSCSVPAAGADLCGISSRLCVSAESKVSVMGHPRDTWWTKQDWSPWRVQLDPATSSMEVEYQFGGIENWQAGGAIEYGNTSRKRLHHDIAGCTGHVSSGRVELEAGGLTIVLLFEAGKLVEVRDPAALSEGDFYTTAMFTQPSDEDDPLERTRKEVRSVSRVCPGAPTGPASSGSTASGPGVTAKASTQTPAGSSRPSKVEFEKAAANPQGRVGAGQAAEVTGAAGASNVGFGEKSPDLQAREKTQAEADFKSCINKSKQGKACAAAGSYYYVNDEPAKAKALWGHGCEKQQPRDAESCQLRSQFFGK